MGRKWGRRRVKGGGPGGSKGTCVVVCWGREGGGGCRVKACFYILYEGNLPSFSSCITIRVHTMKSSKLQLATIHIPLIAYQLNDIPFVIHFDPHRKYSGSKISVLIFDAFHTMQYKDISFIITIIISPYNLLCFMIMYVVFMKVTLPSIRVGY